MAGVPRRVLSMLFYLTFAVMATIWISMKYLNDRDCSEFCKHQSKFEHDFGLVKTKREAPSTKSVVLQPSSKLKNKDKNLGPHQLGIVVPFRNRFEELLDFVPHMHSYLNKKKVRHKIYVVDQVDKHRFNRASLLNVGYLMARNDCDYIAMHDVDLLPLNKDLNYDYPDNGPFHVSAPHLHPKYHYKTFVGGILIMSNEQFEKVNGLSNKFWGWGREDDELYARMMDAGMKVYRHSKKDIKTGYQTFKHEHDPQLRKRDYKRYFNQKQESFRRDRQTGLHDVSYKVVKSDNLSINGAPCTLMSVELECDYEVTPWCDNPKQ